MKSVGVLLIIIACLCFGRGVYLFEPPHDSSEDLTRRILAAQEQYSNGGNNEAEKNRKEISAFALEREKSRRLMFGVGGIGAVLGFMLLVLNPRKEQIAHSTAPASPNPLSLPKRPSFYVPIEKAQFKVRYGQGQVQVIVLKVFAYPMNPHIKLEKGKILSLDWEKFLDGVPVSYEEILDFASEERA